MQNWTATLQAQYANSQTIVDLISDFNTYIDPTVNIDAFYNDVWNIETASGNGLDIWGRIVGVGRVLTIGTGSYFGFQGPVGASGTGFNQGIFYSGNNATSNFSLLDGPYRVLILTKAFANICQATIPVINQLLINLFGPGAPFQLAGNSYCTDGENMTMTLKFPAALSPVQSAIINNSGVLPIPCGVSYTVVT